MYRFAVAVCMVGATVGVAHAQSSNSLSQDEMNVVKPEGQADTAVHKPGRIPWCPPGRFTLDVWDKGRLRRGVSSRPYLDGGVYTDAIEHICQWADDPTWQRQATYMLQSLMNSEGVTQEEAVELMKKAAAANKKRRDNEGKEPTDEERFEFSEHALTPVKTEPGVDTAKLAGAPAWCDKAGTFKPADRWDPNRISRSGDAQYGIQGVVEAAYHICQRPNDPTWKQKGRDLLQKWMNWTKQSQPDAEASLRTRIQLSRVEKDREELCKDLEYSPELGGEAKAYAMAHQRFFGCHDSKPSELWREQSVPMDDKVGFYFDADDKLESEIIRLYWLFAQTEDPKDELPSKSAFDNRSLMRYAVASVDYTKIDEKALAKQVADQFGGNDYARAVINESVALLKWRRKMFENAIDKLAKGGEEYKAILRDAPKKGFADWEKLTAAWKPELERSSAFEKKLSQPSRKALAGCAAELQKDAQKLIKSYKLSDYNELIAKVGSDPIAQLLLSRLAVCFAVEKQHGGSGALKDLVKGGRDLRGPRSMAYYAVVDTLVETLKDRPRLLLQMNNFDFRTASLVDIYDGEFSFSGAVRRDPEEDRMSGYVKSVTKGKQGMQVVFKAQKSKYPEYNCVSTGRPIRITNDGRIEYQQNCKATGKMLTQDNTPRPITIAPMLAAGVKAGAYIVATRAPVNGVDEGAVVAYVKKKPEDKKISTFFGFSL